MSSKDTHEGELKTVDRYLIRVFSADDGILLSSGRADGGVWLDWEQSAKLHGILSKNLAKRRVTNEADAH